MEPPPEMKRGPKVVREAFNTLRLWAISQRPLPSLDCDVHDTPQGRVILPRLGGMSTPVQARETRPFQLVPSADEEGNPKLRVIISTLAALLPEGFSEADDPPFLLDVSETGVVYGKIEINAATGEILSSVIENGASVPQDTVTAFHVRIGGYTMEDGAIRSVSNYRYGPIDAQVCRVWYRTEEPFYAVNFWPQL